MNKITPINLEDKTASHSSIKQAAHHNALTTDNFAESAKGKTGFYRIIKAAGYSMDGFRAAYKFEAAFRQVVCLNLALFVAIAFMPFAMSVKMLLVIASFLSLIVELLNTGIEACVDHTSTAKHPLAKIAKDVGSAAQFVSLCLLTILWLMALSVFL